jgi:hypothetical protein
MGNCWAAWCRAAMDLHDMIKPVTDLLSDTDRMIVRHACGSGCIRCGCTIIEYCAPEAGAEMGNLVLLCPVCSAALNHMANSEAMLQTLRHNPILLQSEFDRSRLPFASVHELPEVRIGAATMRQIPYPLTFGGAPVVEFHPAEFSGGPLRLSIALGDGGGEPAWVVENNEWRAADGWLFARSDGYYHFASPDGEAQLTLRFLPNEIVVIEALATWNDGRRLIVDRSAASIDGIAITLPNARARLVGANL